MLQTVQHRSEFTARARPRIELNRIEATKNTDDLAEAIARSHLLGSEQ